MRMDVYKHLKTAVHPSILTLSHCTSDVAQPGLMLQLADGNRYLFGRFGEGLQRILTELKAGYYRSSNLFLTGPVSWESTSGLPGMMISVSDLTAGVKIHHQDPKRLAHMMDSWKNLTTHSPIKATCTSEQFYEDDDLAVVSVSLDQKSAGELTRPVWGESHIPASIGSYSTDHLPSTSYIVQFLPKRGKFDGKLAEKLGVFGKARGELTQGKTVTGKDGQIVTPEDVLGPVQSVPRFLVLDLPTKEHLKSALEYNEWVSPMAKRPATLNNLLKAQSDESLIEQHQNDKPEFTLQAVYLFCGKDIDLDSLDFSTLTNKFKDAHVLVSHPELADDWMVGTRNAQLNDVQAKTMPRYFSKYAMRPAARAAPSSICALKTGQVLELAFKSGSNPAQLQNVMPYTTKSEQGKLPSADLTEPEIYTLGTGASAPSISRNVAGTLVRVPGPESISSVLFDCGEATICTLTRIFGRGANLKQILNEMKVLYVSHMHADHHLGSAGVIRAWLEANDDSKSLTVIGPPPLAQFLATWAVNDKCLMGLKRVTFVESQTLLKPKNSSVPGLLDAALCHASHCKEAYCCRLTLEGIDKPYMLAYSGDTRPTDRFSKLALGADLMIHESTHDDGLSLEATSKGHSTMGQAINVGRDMMAKCIVLTHFSQRYPGLPLPIEIVPPSNVLEHKVGGGPDGFSTYDDGTIVMAFDGLCVRPSDATKYRDALRQASATVFPTRSEEEEEESITGSSQLEQISKETKKRKKSS